MSSLIKNELKKVFHKKLIYVVFIITVICMIGICILNKYLSKVYDDYNYIEENIEYFQEALSKLDKNNPEEKEEYIMYEANLEGMKLKLKYEEDSWQCNIIDTKGYDIILQAKETGDTEEYDNFLKRLEQDDWRSFAKEDLESINEQIKEEKANGDEDSVILKNLEVKKQCLEMRLEKNISYATSNKNTLIEDWLSYAQELNQREEDEKSQSVTYSDKYYKQNSVAISNVAKYSIENDCSDNFALQYVNNTYIISSDANGELIDVFSNYSLFILIAIIIIAGTIISEEFNKGTIKLLLVKPYNRTKIFMAKFITCCIILLLAIIVISLLQFILGGIQYGFSDYSNEIIVYNFSTNSVETTSLIKYLMLTVLGMLPMYFLLMTLSFTLSTLFNNSPVAIALPLIGYMGAETINQIAYDYYNQAKFLMYFVTPNWNLTTYLYGMLPQMESLSLPFSICICLIYFAIMVFASMWVFKKRDIKNI